MHELCDGSTHGSFTSWGISEVTLCVVFKSSSLADLFSIKQYLVILKKKCFEETCFLLMDFKMFV